MSTIAERVAAGAVFLDEHDPGWWQRIDLAVIDLGSPCCCVLGQLHLDKSPNPAFAYRRGRDALGLSANRGRELGFDAYQDDMAGDVGAEYYDLTAEWKRVITGRRTAVAS